MEEGERRKVEPTSNSVEIESSQSEADHLGGREPSKDEHTSKEEGKKEERGGQQEQQRADAEGEMTSSVAQCPGSGASTPKKSSPLKSSDVAGAGGGGGDVGGGGGVSGTSNIGGGGGGGLATLARQLSKSSKSKSKGVANANATKITSATTATASGVGGSSTTQNAKAGGVASGHDDLPLGSEATSLPAANTGETRDLRRNGRPDPRWMLGWQSFNSDVSNQTTGSSASLEMLLNTRQVDPETMLRNLGFGGGMQTILPSLERVPERFLNHPSQAYGIADYPAGDEPGDDDSNNEDAAQGAGRGRGGGTGGQDSPTGSHPMDGSNSSGGTGGGAGGAVPASMSRRKPKTGIWTVARTLSMFGNLNRQPHHPAAHGHHRAQGDASPPVEGVPPGSVLNLPNRLYLASRGYYKQFEKQNGKSKPEKIKETNEEEGEEEEGRRGRNQQEREDVAVTDRVSRTVADASTNAASKRRMFQKTRSRQTWSLCEEDSGDEAAGGGGDTSKAKHKNKKHSSASTSSDHWVTQSLDESLSREDSANGIGDDSLSKFAYFSTTTESSTDSIDGRNSDDTEKALEEIRQQYKDGQMGLLPKKERSSSEDLFFPSRTSSGNGDRDGVATAERSGSGGVSGGRGRNVRFGDLSDDDEAIIASGGSGSSSKRRRGVGDEVDAGRRDLLHHRDLDLLKASLDNYHGENSNGSGVSSGGSGGGMYFISPAHSRQSTVEKAPSMSGDNDIGGVNDDNDDNADKYDNSDGIGQMNRSNNDPQLVEEFMSCESSTTVSATRSTTRGHHGRSSRNGDENGGGSRHHSGNADVRIVVSSSTEIVSDAWHARSDESDGTVGGVTEAPPTSTSSPSSSSRLGGGLQHLQRASSDSGSSSSGTAVGSASVVTMTTDDLDPTRRLSESENSITDRDSISRTNSPSGFLNPWGQGHGQGQGHYGRSSGVELVSCGVQTSREDILLAMEQAEKSEREKEKKASEEEKEKEVLYRNRKRDGSPSSFPGDGRPVERSSNGCQLSSLPQGINPVQLMKRLHHSQDELLPRVNSLQSDSSGFGDGEPVEGADGRENLVKVSTLGSSSESTGTTATLASLTRKDEIATQTSIDETQSGTLASSTNYASDGPIPSDMDTSKPAKYISHCIILHNASSKSKSAKDSQHQNDEEEGSSGIRCCLEQYQQQRLTYPNQSQLKPQAFSTPLSPTTQDPSLNDYYYYQHQFLEDNDNSNNDDNKEKNDLVHQYRYPPNHSGDRRIQHPHSDSSNVQPSTKEDIPGTRNQNFFNFDPAPRGYEPSLPFQDHHFYHPHHHRLYHHHHQLHHYSEDRTDHYSLDEGEDHHHHHSNHHHHHRHHHNPHHHHSPHSHHKKHHHHHHHHHHSHRNRSHSKSSDEINDSIELLDSQQPHIRSRNQTPLSEELAKASSSPSSYSSNPQNGGASSSLTTTSPSSAAITAATSTPIYSKVSSRNDNDNNNNNNDNVDSNNRVISSVKVLITGDGSHKASATTTTNVIGAPSSSEKAKNRSRDASHISHYPPLAGNVSGVIQKDDYYANSSTTSKPPPVFPSPLRKNHPNTRQKSCDILDDDDNDDFESENRLFKTVGGSGGRGQQRRKDYDDDDDGDFETFSPSTCNSDFAMPSANSDKAAMRSETVTRTTMASGTSSRFQYADPSLLTSPRHGYLNNQEAIDDGPSHGGGRRRTLYSSSSSQGSSRRQHQVPPVIPMTFSPRHSDAGVGAGAGASFASNHPSFWYPAMSADDLRMGGLTGRGSGRSVYPSPTPPLSRTWDDLEGGYSSMAETSSEFSIRSTPVGGMGRRNTGVLESQKLARLVNRPSSLKGTRRRPTASYQPRRSFREWNVLSRRKRLMEEDHLLQHSVHKYKTELSLMQAAFLNEYGKALEDMTPEEKEEVHELEWLWGEVKGQLAEMEELVSTRVQSVHAGNDFHSLLSSLGVINKTIELLKEQIYQQQVLNQHGNNTSHNGEGESIDDLDDFDELEGDDLSSRGSILSTHSMMEGFGGSWSSWRRPPSRGSSRSSSNFNRRKLQSSVSTSNLPADISMSLEEMKSSLLLEMKNEIKESTRKLEDSLTKKELEIQELKKRLAASKPPHPLPSTTAVGQGQSSSSSFSSFTTSSKTTRSSTKVQRRSQALIARSRSRVIDDRVVRETDI